MRRTTIGPLALLLLLAACGSDEGASSTLPPDGGDASSVTVTPPGDGAVASDGGGDGGLLGDAGPPPVLHGDIYLNVMPPGSNGNSAGGVRGLDPSTTVYPANFTDALALYGDLSYAKQGLTSDPCAPPRAATEHVKASNAACNYFKHEALTPDVVASTETITTADGKTVTIRRDGWGVPFVDAPDRASAMVGFGYASAEDRLWLHDVLRHLGRGQLSQYLGPAQSFYDFDASLATVAAYSEDELTAMVEGARKKYGALGDLIVSDVDHMVAGINAYVATLTGKNAAKLPPEYTALRPGGFPPAAWTRNDIVASATLIQSIFATGGGTEQLNELLLQHLDPSVKPGVTAIPAGACALWRDVRHADDPDAPRTLATPFHTQSPPGVSESCPQALPAGAAIWDPGSFTTRSIFTTNLGFTPGGGGILPGARRGAGRRTHARSPAGLKKHAGYTVRADVDPIRGVREALRRAGFPLPNTMSNFIGVTGALTKTGHPIAVMGPQTSYFLPQLLWEVSITSHGGTPLDFAGRGVVFGDLPYINIGRGVDYAWSATSGESDLVDIRVSKLCNLPTNPLPPSRNDVNGDGFPDADGYLFDANDGKGSVCRPFYKRTDTWNVVPTPASIATDGTGNPISQIPQVASRYVLRTHYGPVFATATVSGAPVAVSLQRSTFFGELETAAPFALASTPTVKDAASFQKIFQSVTGAFNWLYIDAKHLGYLHSGLYPERDAAQHPELPVWGDGRFEWAAMKSLPAGFFTSFGGTKVFDTNLATPAPEGDPLGGAFDWPGYLPFASHPQAIDPASGMIWSWNNSPAPGWWAADGNGSYGPTHRVDMLKKRLEAFVATGKKLDVGNMVEIMADAAYTDLRGQEVLPLLLQIMQAGTMTDDQKAVASLMQTWIDEGSNRWITGQPGFGAFRRDRDGNGTYDARAAVVLMDAWYPHLIEKVLPQLDAIDKAGVSVLQARYDAPRAQGSAYQEGWFEHMKRVLQMALGTPGHTDYRALKCADGTKDGCRAAVLAALDAALTDLGGVAAEASWDGTKLTNAKGKAGATVEAYDSVEHTAISFLAVASLPWLNRPTFQQAIQIETSR